MRRKRSESTRKERGVRHGENPSSSWREQVIAIERLPVCNQGEYAHTTQQILIQLRVSHRPYRVIDERNHGIPFAPRKSRKNILFKALSCLRNFSQNLTSFIQFLLRKSTRSNGFSKKTFRLFFQPELLFVQTHVEKKIWITEIRFVCL